MRRVGMLVAVVAVLVAFQLPGQAQSTTVQITVPPTQVLEGVTSVTLASSSDPQSGRLTVKSNIPWTLRVDIDARGSAVVAWRPQGATSWQVLPQQGAVLSGSRGVHVVEYQLQITTASPAAAGSAVVRFSLIPQQ